MRCRGRVRPRLNTGRHVRDVLAGSGRAALPGRCGNQIGAVSHVNVVEADVPEASEAPPKCAVARLAMRATLQPSRPPTCSIGLGPSWLASGVLALPREPSRQGEIYLPNRARSRLRAGATITSTPFEASAFLRITGPGHLASLSSYLADRGFRPVETFCLRATVSRSQSVRDAVCTRAAVGCSS